MDLFYQSPSTRNVMPTWIDFKELRSKLSFEQVLGHYGVELKRRGEQHMGFCPLPGHTGNRNSPSFSANLEWGIFHCFGCQAKGNVLDFAVLMSGESIENGRALKKVAAELRAKFFPEDVGRSTTKKKEKKVTEAPRAQLELSSIVNPTLDFELRDLDPSHPYLAQRRFSKETIGHFGLGYCSRGFFAGRIAIPLNDTRGNLIGYAGRVVDDAAITEENPRYRFPSKREREGAVIEFRKTLFLYNGFRIKSPRDNVGVVEGFPSVWWLHQNGFPCVVATMGAECSDEQAALIVSLVKPGGHIWIVPDGDKAGEKLANSLLAKLSPHRFVRWLKLAAGRQPTDLPAEELKASFTL
jgi:DNA primase